MERWYVVFTRPRQEQTAADNLARQGYRCLLPRARVWKNLRGRRSLVVEPFFPRYLFVQLDLDSTNTAPIRSTIGVVGLVRFGDRIPPLPTALVDEIMAHVDDDAVLDLEPQDFEIGQQVRVLEGPLAGNRAIFLARSGEERALLLLDMLGREIRIGVPLSSLSAET